MIVATEQQLEDLLSEPSEADAQAMASLPGDLLILGAGGKMGPSLARRAQRACELGGVKKRVIAVARFSTAGTREFLDPTGVETIAADLLQPEDLAALPYLHNVIFITGLTLGSPAPQHLTSPMHPSPPP